MKTLQRYAGQRTRVKYDTGEYAARYWALGAGDRYVTRRPFNRGDGSTGVDKTRGFHSRPTQKQCLRNANRAFMKSARRTMKQELVDLARV
jgi:hypothetical protein